GPALSVVEGALARDLAPCSINSYGIFVAVILSAVAAARSAAAAESKDRADVCGRMSAERRSDNRFCGRIPLSGSACIGSFGVFLGAATPVKFWRLSASYRKI